MAKLRTDAAAQPASYGFVGDPHTTPTGTYYGYLEYAGVPKRLDAGAKGTGAGILSLVVASKRRYGQCLRGYPVRKRRGQKKAEEEGAMLERKLELLARILDEPRQIENHELKIIS